MDPKILENIRNQSARLIAQLQELEELKSEIEPEEYDELKKDTLEQLKVFQQKLLEIQSGDLSLQNEIQKQQEKQLRNAIKKSFNADEIKKLMSSTQGQNIRERIKKLELDQNLGRLDKTGFIQQTLQCINQLQDMQIELLPEEKQFLNQHTGKQNFVQQDANNMQGQQILKSAEQQLTNNQFKK